MVTVMHVMIAKNYVGRFSHGSLVSLTSLNVMHYRGENIGPNMDPCGIPRSISFLSLCIWFTLIKK